MKQDGLESIAEIDTSIAILNMFVVAELGLLEGECPMKTPLNEPEFVSRQVAEAKRYYLNLKPGKKQSVTVVCGGVERMQREYVVHRDSFPYCAIELVTEGAGSLTLEGNRFDLVPGTVFAYGPSTQHRIENKPPKRMRKYYVDFWGSDAEAHLRELGLLNSAPLHATRPYELIEIFEWLDREARYNGGRTEPMCQALLVLLFEKIRQLCVPHQTSLLRSFETYERVREQLERHFLKLSTIEELAEKCRLTPVHISRLFR